MPSKKRVAMTSEDLLISYDYPHGLMMHVSEIIKEKKNRDLSYLLEKEFVDTFMRKFLKYPHEIVELNAAYEEGIIEGFVNNHRSESWKKRVFLNTSLAKLVRKLPEYEAVELIESMMNLFRWEFEVVVHRKWEVKDQDKAWYHNFFKPSDVSEEKFEQRIQKYVEYQEREKRVQKRRKIDWDKIKPLLEQIDLEELKAQSRWKKKRGAGKSDNKQERQKKTTHREVFEKSVGKGNTKNTGTGSRILEEMLMIKDWSEEEYKKELRSRQIKHEHLMSLSVRRNIRQARRGDASAQNRLGEFYAEPDTKHTDYREAVRWYGFSARQGSRKAKFEIGRIFDSERITGEETKDEGIRYFMELAEEGYPTAQCIVGMKYCFGDGLEKDTSKGMRWLLKAADQGSADAQKHLGDYYSSRDVEKAVEWYQKAAVSGSKTAEKRLKQIRQN